MRKELTVLRHGSSAPRGVRIHHGLIQDALGFYFLGIRTRVGFLFIQVRAFPHAAVSGRAARLRRCSQVLRYALDEAVRRARRRQAQLGREQLLERQAALLCAAEQTPPSASPSPHRSH